MEDLATTPTRGRVYTENELIFVVARRDLGEDMAATVHKEGKYGERKERYSS